MWEIAAVLAAAGIHTGWIAVPPAEPVSTLAGLTVGEMVHVEDVHGRRVNGAVAEASLTALRIVGEERSVILQADEVQTVGRRDSVLNGVLFGLAAGMVGMHVEGRIGVCGGSVECFIYIALPVTLVGGAAIGARVDALMHGTLYRRPGAAQVRVSPIVSRDRMGARLSMTW